MRLLNSVVVSTMVSESRVFTCREFPEWMRLFWLLWAALPVVIGGVVWVISFIALTIEADFITGLGWLFGPFLPIAYAVG